MSLFAGIVCPTLLTPLLPLLVDRYTTLHYTTPHYTPQGTRRLCRTRTRSRALDLAHTRTHESPIDRRRQNR